MLDHVFGPVDQWPDQDLIAFSDDLSEGLVLAAYRSGVFPMPLHEGTFSPDVGWWSPMRRGVLPLTGLRVTRSLRQAQRRYTTTIDQAFDRVIAACADPRRPHGWIDGPITEVYTALHRRGIVHSVETWDADGELVGGLYGVSIGGLFAGESMFHDRVRGRDASKVALVRLVEVLAEAAPGPRLLDIQWVTPHLASLGAIEVSRARYLDLLDQALEAPDPTWPASRSRT